MESGEGLKMRRPLSIAANTQKVDVDNRMSLRYYYRIADNMLKQARVYREERNLIDLYIILLRFSSTFSSKEKAEYRKKLRKILNELEELKPEAQRRVNELNESYANPVYDRKRDYASVLSSPETSGPSWVWPTHNGRRSSNSEKRNVQYPSQLDLSPIEIPSFYQVGQNSHPAVKIGSDMTLGNIEPESCPSLDFDSRSLRVDDPCSLPSACIPENNIHLNLVRQPSPPPVHAHIQTLPAGLDALTHIPELSSPRHGPGKSSQDDLSTSNTQYVQISTKMMDDFMKLAKFNTEKNLETCGVLAGSLKKRIFYVTTLIIPKQESTSDSCQTMNEEEIYAVQDERSLFPLGWIHVMLPEAIAIVMAPTDTIRSFGIFQLSDPGGITVIKQCQQRGFHPHEEPPDGSPIYDHSSHVLMNPNLRFDVIDLR